MICAISGMRCRVGGTQRGADLGERLFDLTLSRSPALEHAVERDRGAAGPRRLQVGELGEHRLRLGLQSIGGAVHLVGCGDE